MSYPVSLDVSVRFRDLDALRHVNNSVFLTYLETAREAYWNALGYGLDLEGYGYILARIECDFRAPILYQGPGTRIRVSIRCARLGTKSWEYEYRVEDVEGATLFAEARSVQVYSHIPANRTEPIPPEIRNAFDRLEGRA
ncbi:MAG TPA: thioesterase family protein [Thermoanaerobaculia bacterium]|nr:thioesterase family protein [Thermoanaerobaculia bacterium]